MFHSKIIPLFLLFICIALDCTYAVLNFKDENLVGDLEADRYDWSKHPCRRNCQSNEKPKTCKYVFVIEQYTSMSKACYDCPFNQTDCSRPHCIPADGVLKMIYVINRQMPGPLIEVCVNDQIEVEVRNRMASESTTIHWHGIEQHDTPYMDGVPYVTQCPILPGENFLYRFKAAKPGTFFYHSHMGVQRSDGFFGTLVIKTPPAINPHHKLYDIDEHRMIITDWNYKESGHQFAKLIYEKTDVIPTTILINGLGRYQEYKRNDSSIVYTPSAVFSVIKGKSYRFRLISAGSANCPIEVSVDEHKMFVISLDAYDVEPVKVDTITIWPGERADFIIKASKKIDNYWIRYRGYGRCESERVHQVAILNYEGAKIQDPKSPVDYDLPVYTDTTKILNPYNLGQEAKQKHNISIPYLNALAPNDITSKEKADQQIYLNFDFYPLDNYGYHRKNLYGSNQVSVNHRMASPQLNHISFKFPNFPLLTQRNMIEPNMLCDSSTIDQEYCEKEHCACTHVINVKLNSVVELIFVDEGKYAVINHPLHLHGHSFRVIATENLDDPITIDDVKKLDKEGKINRRLDRPPIKDVMKTPGGGYSIVRFYANNPGYWIFHCHFEEHMEVGMALVFKVGEHKDMAKPPRNFPKCGNINPKTKTWIGILLDFLL